MVVVVLRDGLGAWAREVLFRDEFSSSVQFLHVILEISIMDKTEASDSPPTLVIPKNVSRALVTFASSGS